MTLIKGRALSTRTAAATESTNAGHRIILSESDGSKDDAVENR